MGKVVGLELALEVLTVTAVGEARRNAKHRCRHLRVSVFSHVMRHDETASMGFTTVLLGSSVGGFFFQTIERTVLGKKVDSAGQAVPTLFFLVHADDSGLADSGSLKVIFHDEFAEAIEGFAIHDGIHNTLGGDFEVLTDSADIGNFILAGDVGVGGSRSTLGNRNGWSSRSIFSGHISFWFL